MPSLTPSCYSMFSSYLWEACSFLKGNRGAEDLRERGDGGGLKERRKGMLQS